MTENTKKFHKVSAIKNFKTHLMVGNVVVATRNQLKYTVNGSDWWNDLETENKFKTVSDIDSLIWYTYDELTPEGQKMKDEAEAARKAKEDEEDDD